MLKYIYRCSGKIASFLMPWRRSAKAINALWYQVRKNKESIDGNSLSILTFNLLMKKRGRPVGRPRKK